MDMTKKELAIQYAFCFIGKWYKWGGSNPDGFDCSGLCIEVAQAVGIFPRHFDGTAQSIYQELRFKQVTEPHAGCFVFYGKSINEITHIEFCIDDQHSIGASGGGSKTLTEANAIRDNAFIKIRPIRSRKDVAVFVDPFQGT